MGKHDIDDICKWIVDGWKELGAAIVANVFKNRYISNKRRCHHIRGILYSNTGQHGCHMKSAMITTTIAPMILTTQICTLSRKWKSSISSTDPMIKASLKGSTRTNFHFQIWMPISTKNDRDFSQTVLYETANNPFQYYTNNNKVKNYSNFVFSKCVFTFEWSYTPTVIITV